MRTSQAQDNNLYGIGASIFCHVERALSMCVVYMEFNFHINFLPLLSKRYKQWMKSSERSSCFVYFWVYFENESTRTISNCVVPWWPRKITQNFQFILHFVANSRKLFYQLGRKSFTTITASTLTRTNMIFCRFQMKWNKLNSFIYLIFNWSSQANKLNSLGLRWCP